MYISIQCCSQQLFMMFDQVGSFRSSRMRGLLLGFQPHADNHPMYLAIQMLAFVPPKPKLFESAALTM